MKEKQITNKLASVNTYITDTPAKKFSAMLQKLESKENIVKIHIFTIFKNWIKNIFDKDDVLTLDQQLAFDIFKICLYDDNNIRYLNASNSYKKYIVNKKFILDKDVSTFIILESGKITIINHTYKYDIEIPQHTSLKMNKMFDNKVDEDRSIMEKEILGNITSSLNIVLTNFKNSLEEKI